MPSDKRPDLEKRYGKSIRDLLLERLQRGLTQRQIADELGVTQEAISRWIREERIRVRRVYEVQP